ncbi:MAG: glycosyltransferase family 4 protein [Deltaproteobacteria bacterium]|nr:glycosyltransferase family 4 protein [Deltaproteobacteria bacterium]
MKILYFTTFDLSLAKGPSINEREFVGQLLRHPGVQARAIVPSSALALGEFPKESLRPIRHAWGPSTHAIISSERDVERALLSEVDVFKPDMVVGRLALLPFGCLRALRCTDTPLAIKSLGSAGFVANGWSLNQIAVRGLRPLVRWLLRRVVQRACTIDSTTNELRSLIINQVGARPNAYYVVPNATNVDRFVPGNSMDLRESLGIPPQGVVVGYAGGDPWQRGGCEVIQAVARLRAEGVDAYGVVVGGAESALLELARQYGIIAQFHAPGRVDYATVPQWINLIDLGVAFDHSQRAAWIGNSYQKVRQFVACGRFIITQTDDLDQIARCPLVVRVRQKDTENIYWAILEILELSDSERKARQLSGRTFAERHLSLAAALEMRLHNWKSALGYGSESGKTPVITEKGVCPL